MSRWDDIKNGKIGSSGSTEEDSNLSRWDKIKKSSSAVTSDGSDLKSFATDYESFMTSDYDEKTASDLRGRITDLMVMYNLNRGELSKEEEEMRSYLNKAKYSIVGLGNKIDTNGAQGWQKYLDDEAKANATEDESFWDKLGRWLGSTGATDTSIPLGNVPQITHDLREDQSHRRPNNNWTAEQKNTFGYYYAQSPELAYAYAEATNKANDKAKEEQAIKDIQDSATSSFGAGFGHTLGAIATAPLGMADFLDYLVKANAGKDPLESDGEVSPFEYSQAVTGGISEHLNEKGGTLDEDIPIFGGKGWGDVYGLGTSIAQSAVSGLTMGGAGTLVSYFGQGAASGMKDALERGATNEQAAIYGIALGAFEGIAESIGIDNLFKIGSSATLKGLLKNVLKQAGAEGMEEGLTSIFNNIADALIMQDKSNFNAMVTMYMSQGMSEEEAKKQAWMDSVEGIAFDTIAGSVSGGVHGGVATSIHTGIANHNASKVYGNESQTLVDEALASEFSDTKAVGQKFQDKLSGGKKLSGWNLNELLEATDKSKLKSAILHRLGELGETSDVSAVADVLIRQAMGEELSSKDTNILNKSKAGHTVLAEINEDNIKSGGLGNNWAESIGTRVINPKAYNKTAYDRAEAQSALREAMERGSVFKTVEDVEGATGESIEVSESGKTIYEDAYGNAENVSVKKIVSTKGGVKVELDNGKTVNASDLRFGSKEEGLMYEMVARMEVTPDTANEIIKSFKPTSVQQATMFFTTVPLAYQYGKINYEAGLKNINLPKALKRIAFNRGRMDAITTAKAQTKATTSKKGKTETSSKKKEIIFEDGFVYDESTASEMQKKSMVGIEVINKMSNLEVHIFESKVVTVDGESKRIATINGKERPAPHGYFKDGNKIYIDINAGNGGEGAMLYTMSHEVTHYIKKWNAKGFKELGDFLIAEYGKRGVPVNALLEEQKKRVIESRKKDRVPIPSEAQLADLAYEELVADAMSDMFTDPKAYEKLAKLKQKNRTLWEKLGEAIKSLLDKLKTALGIYKTKDVPVADEAFFVRGFSAEVYDKLQDLYIKAFVEADANYASNASGIESAVSEVIEADAKPISSDEIITDGAVVTDGEGNKYSLRSMKHDITEGQMFRDLMTYCKFTKEQVRELRTQLNDLVDYMTPHRDIVDLNETYGIEGRRYAPYKPNSDPLYTISLDFSTQCSKRLLTQYVIEQLQLRENRPMSPEEQMAIRDMLKEYGKVEKGLQVACVMCYVEAARLKAPKQIQKWLDDPATAMRNFFADKNPEFAAYIKEAQADFKESRGYERDATKKEMKAKDITALNKIRPKLRAEYKPSAEEMKIIETASSLPNSTYLTAGNLADLSETHPEIYKAYTAFIRTATRSKALETDEPYYYGDSRRDNGNGIIVSDSFIEAVNRENGMRFSSWSDWRIQHLLDWITAVIDNSVRGAAMHGYTKYGDEVRVLGKTGMMFNMSGVAGTQTGLNEDGSLNFSETESMDYEEAMALREEFPETAGLQCIGVGVDHIYALLRSDIIDYVIPYHTSGLNATLRRMGDIYGWKDFTQTQHATEDNSIKKENAVDPEHWHQEPVFSEFFVGYDTGLSGVEAMRKSAENYKRMCKERGLKPKFLEFANEPNYWKLLIDRKMVNQKTNTLIKQRAVTPDFDFGVIKGIVDKYVANYDSGLEQRAFNHIVKNWGNIPQRIRDLKKQGSTKAKTTKKAIDKLANEPLAVQPKDDTMLSDRDSNTIANDFLAHIDGILKERGWRTRDVLNYIDNHPELDFIDRIHGKDKTAKKDLEDFLKGIDNTRTLERLSWFIGRAYSDLNPEWDYNGSKYYYPYQGAVRTFRNAIKRRTNEIMSAKVNGTNLGIKNGEVSLEEVKGFFNRLNSNEEIGEFAKKVFATAERLGVNIRFVNQTFSKGVAGNAVGDMVEYKTSYFNDTAVSDQRKASVILHELIHSCTVYVLNANTIAGDVYYRNKTQNYENIANAATRLNRIFAEIQNDPDFKGKYGTTDTMEMVAELSNENFVAKLKQKNLWQTIVDWICELFGINRGTSAYENAVMCVDYILDNPEISEYKAFAKGQRRAAHREGLDAFGSTVDVDGSVMYSDRDTTSYAPTFYSHMGKVVDGIKSDKVGANGVVPYLKGKGVKDEEIKWSGIEAFLEGKKSVTKAELQEFIAGSQLQIVEQMSDDEEYTRWSQYKLDGGSNYRELVFQMPNSTYSNQAMRTHWGDEGEGILAHARIQDMTTADGKKMLFVEEIQSDWHNIGAVDGYVDSKEEARLEELKAKADEAFFRVEDYSVAATGLAGEWEVIKKTPRGVKLLRELQEARDAYANAFNEFVKKIPDAPFRTTYHEYVLKRLLRMAAEEGYDAIGWTPAQIQSERWSEEFAEGYRIEYDQDIPKFLRKYGKKWGTTVGKTTLGADDTEALGKAELDAQAKMLDAEDALAVARLRGDEAEIERLNTEYLAATRDYSKALDNSLRAKEGTEVWSMSIPDSMTESVLYEGQVMYSDRVTDQHILDFLENQEHITTYKSFVEIDGKLYSPMATKVKGDDGKYHLTNPSEIGVWQQAEEKPESIPKFHKTKGYGYYVLKKDDGGSVTAAYNPYEHSSNLVLNDQFESAYQRPNLVTVECVIPKSEMTSGYKAKYAKDSTGYLDWKSGTVAGKLKGNKRKVYLSRWLKPVRILSDAEVASMYKDILGSNISVPFNVVTPQLRAELEKVGVRIDAEGSPGYQYRQGKKETATDTMYSERDPDAISNRTLLANALEGVAQNDIERNKLAQYKSKIALIEREQAKLTENRAEAQELRFKKGRTEAETRRLRDLDAEARQIENRITTYDKQLLNLETTTALKNVLQREKEMLRRRLEQKGKEAVKAQRQKDAATIREIMTRHTESRKKAVESRHKTELRHKIKKVVSDLDTLLRNPTKDQHVPIGLQGVVAEALDAINMDTMNAEERVAYYNDLIARSTNPDEIAMLKRKRDFFEYRDANFKDKIAALKNAYAEFKESDDPLIRNAHNEAIENLIRNTADAVGNKSLKDMSYEQLEAVYDMYKAILATVRNSNKLFKEGRQETISDNSEAVKNEVREVGGHKDRVLKLTKALKKFGWGMLKPITAMKAIGSKTFAKLFDNVRKAEDTWAVDVSEAKKFYDEMSAKYGFKKWDFKKRYTFKDSTGNDFTLSLEQIMSLYAYSKREQADKHLEFGGFIFDDAIEVTEKKLGVPLKYEVNDANPYRLRTEDLLPVVSALTTEQKGFVDEMQTYLSDVMGAKGNEVSLAMYDIKLYKEKNYFPLKTSRYFREFDPEKSATPKIKNAGFSKKTVPQAGNPIVLSNFMDVWAGHVNDMSMYHAFVLPLEDFMRVYNYSSTAGGYDSVQQYIKNAYGAQANQYIEKLMNDLNGGARVDPSASLISQGLSLFKKASVFASASVVVQQPSAIARAVAYINPKYFATATPSAMNWAKHKAVWAEVKKYAPVAVIKEMGYFDTGVGRSTVEWIKGNQTLKDKMDDVLSKAPAIADELAWTYIWEAVKRETKATTTLAWGSEEFLKKCGERFTEIITNTQVYDSVLSRSDMMRSKDTGMKMATAFMAEPTTTLNMMVDGIIQGKRGNKKFTAATVGAVASSIILNSILVALVYAARDDDEDETYAEKYIGSLTTELLDGFNPLTYVPFVKDVWSIAQGYDVERSDMSVISKLWESIEGVFNEDKSGWEKVLEVSGAVSSLFGIPLKNIIRDAKGMFNLAETVLSGTPTTKGGIREAIEESVTSSIPLWDRLNESKTNADRLYDAILSGDQAQIDRVKGRYDDEKAIESAMRQGLRENDPRIKEAAQARYEGNITEYTRIAKEIIAEGNFSQDTIVGAINSEISAIKREESTDDTPTEDRNEATSIYSATDVSVAFDNGDNSTALAIIDDLINTKMANGKTKKEAQSSIRSSMTSYWKPLYKQAYQSGNYSEMERIRRILYSSGLYGTANDVVKTAKNWLKD